MIKTALFGLLTLSVLCGCSEKEEKKREPGMKCGAGKCGANMFDGSAALLKKKKNIFSQMRENDPRKDCVKNALTTKALYDCVRDPKGKKLTMKCGNNTMSAEDPAMKCGSEKCGGS